MVPRKRPMVNKNRPSRRRPYQLTAAIVVVDLVGKSSQRYSRVGGNMLRRFLILAAVWALVGMAGCDKSKQKQSDAPAGHPDELKDSTRLDPAPQQKEGDQPGPQ